MGVKIVPMALPSPKLGLHLVYVYLDKLLMLSTLLCSLVPGVASGRVPGGVKSGSLQKRGTTMMVTIKEAGT